MSSSLKNGKKIKKAYKLDSIDENIISLLLFGSDHKNISTILHVGLTRVPGENFLKKNRIMRNDL